jgi:triosephosphate isomerase
MIVLNLKTYPLSLEKAIEFTDIAKEVSAESGIRIAIAPPTIHLKEAALHFDEVFAQHVDANSLGAHTGSVPLEGIKSINVKGSLVNHSEKRIPIEIIEAIVAGLGENSLESLVCAENAQEGAKIAAFKPKYIAVEPPELIGSGVSVSESKPEVVTDSIREIKNVDPDIKVLCGAGVSTAEHVKKAIELGTDGVLLASAFVKAEDPKEFLRGLASQF